MSDKVYVQTERILSYNQFKDLEYELKKKDENIVLLPYGVKVVKPDVIYCKDCKHSYVDGVEVDGIEPFRACKLKRDKESTYWLWVVSDNDYCSWAKRKEE